MLPSTPKQFKRTKREFFARRMQFMDRPLLVVTFQGVLGDFIKMPAFKMKESNQNLTKPRFTKMHTQTSIADERL